MKRTISLIATLAAMSCHAGDKHKTQVVYRTNYVQVPVVCAALDLADVQLEAGHKYRLLVSDNCKPWRNWGTICAASNTAARVWFPAASTRPMAWQLVDWTPGAERVAVVKQAPDCTSKPQWVVLGMGNVRPVK
jgi:hypothetical protein